MPKKIDYPEKLSLNFGKFGGHGQGRFAVIGLLAAYVLALAVILFTLALVRGIF